MSTLALQRLEFVISMLDRVSGPAGKMMKTMDRVTTNIQAGYQKIGFGAAGLVGAAFSVDRLVQPAKDFQAAIGEVSSLNVAQETLDRLQQTALQTSTEFGVSASDFVRSSYDIQSAIAGLSGNELPAFTRASAILAKGTKADTGTITNYVGTMYGIFKNTADNIGRNNWVEQLAGQTAAAVQMFKTTGEQMSAAFSNIGAEGQAAGISMSEQIAILGQLQATMSGSEAGTKYRAFLAGVGKAQDKLGLQFTDSAGRMLPMVEILGRIQGKFGAIDTVAEADLLTKAFGTKEAVQLIKLLSNDIAGLDSNITAIGKNTGMQQAVDMANAMVQPWDRAGSAVESLSIALGGKMLAVLAPVWNGITGISNKLMEWNTLYPEITGLIAQLALGIFGVIGAVSGLSIVMGIAKLLAGGWTIALMLLQAPLIAMKFAVFQALPAIWGFTAALLANPVTWMVLGVIALGAAIAAAIIYWDQWTAVVIDFSSRFLEMIGVFALVDTALAAWEGLKNWWAGFKAWLSNLDPFAIIGQGIQYLIDKINLIPGININAESLGLTSSPKPPSAPNSGQVQGGAVGNQISSTINQGSQSRSIGDIVINNYGSAPNAAQIRDELIFAGG